jgi:hypothetical protein
MKSVQDRAAQARAYNAAYPTHAHPPVIDPDKLAHERVKRRIGEMSRDQGWGRHVQSVAHPPGKETHIYLSHDYRTAVIHSGAEYVIHRKPLTR